MKNKTIAMCISRIFDIQNHTFIKKLNDSLRKDRINLLVYALNAELYWEENADLTEAYLFNLIHFDKIDALIYMDEKIKSRIIANAVIDKAKAFGIPVLVVDGTYEGCTSVRFNFKKGFETVVRHVIEDHKVKNPHFMAGLRNNPFSTERIEVFKKVIAENGIPFTDDMLSYGDFWAVPARKAMNGVLDKGIVPDAVICANDYMAINVISVLQERGFKVPDDVIVTGFDGIDEARMSAVDITTGDCSITFQADECARVLKLILNGKCTEQEYYVDSKLIKGRSCGCGHVPIESKQLLNIVNDQSYRYQDDLNQFYEMTMRMQMSSDPDEMAAGIFGDKLCDMFCVVNSLCFKRDADFFKIADNNQIPENVSLIYDGNEPSAIRQANDNTIGKLIEHKMESGYPLIFNLLHYMKKAMGYVCFCFRDDDIYQYAKTSSISNYLSLGLGGFINVYYRQYLFDKLEDTYKYDQLTGLYNRLGFTHALEKLKDSHDNEPLPMTIIMSDLDGLKEINDNFGHDEGDNAISVCANALKDSSPENALLLRFGGDEMLAFIPGYCDAEQIINDIDQRLDEYNKHSGRSYKVSASCGSCNTKLTAESKMEEMVREVDESMYETKRKKKDSNSY